MLDQVDSGAKPPLENAHACNYHYNTIDESYF